MNNNWQSIAKQWTKISSNDIRENYNNGKIINPNDLISFANLYKPKDNYILIMMTRKTKNPSKPPQWFVVYMDNFRKEMSDMVDRKLDQRFREFETKLDQKLDQRFKEFGKNFAKLNDLKYE